MGEPEKFEKHRPRSLVRESGTPNWPRQRPVKLPSPWRSVSPIDRVKISAQKFAYPEAQLSRSLRIAGLPEQTGHAVAHRHIGNLSCLVLPVCRLSQEQGHIPLELSNARCQRHIEAPKVSSNLCACDPYKSRSMRRITRIKSSFSDYNLHPGSLSFHTACVSQNCGFFRDIQKMAAQAVAFFWRHVETNAITEFAPPCCLPLEGVHKQTPQ